MNISKNSSHVFYILIQTILFTKIFDTNLNNSKYFCYIGNDNVIINLPILFHTFTLIYIFFLTLIAVHLFLKSNFFTLSKITTYLIK